MQTTVARAENSNKRWVYATCDHHSRLSYDVCLLPDASCWTRCEPGASTGPGGGRSTGRRLASGKCGTIRPNGEVIYPFYGKHPEGLPVYDRSGWMSVQMVSDPQPSVPRSSSRQGFTAAPSEEKIAAVDGYYAYYGTWTVGQVGSSITHHIRQSLYPGERGEEGVRQLTIEDHRLTLMAKTQEMGEEHQRRLVWERVSPALP